MASHRWSWLVKLSFRVATFAYYRFFELNTLGPLRHLSELTVDPDDFPKLVPFLTRWRERKIAELQYLSIAATVFMGSSIGLLGLSLSRSAHWLASAAFYCTILISIFGFCISAEQISILSFLGPVGKGGINCEWTTRSIRRYLAVMLSEVRPEPCKTEAQVTGLGVGVWKLKWKAVFMWQCPFMFLTYDVGLFVFGLTVNICTPLLNGDKWSEAWLTAIIYLAVFGFLSSAFSFCAFLGHHYLDLTALEALEAGEPEEHRPTLHVPLMYVDKVAGISTGAEFPQIFGQAKVVMNSKTS